MARIINKEKAIRIADKLKAETKKGRQGHQVASIYHEGKLVAYFGIRHGSDKEQGHDHISRDLHVGPRDARLLAQCPLSREGWLDILRQKGQIPAAPAAGGLENKPPKLRPGGK